ncbi:MAG TPA: sterol desaturase family protein [Caulobacteraceae bacterium]
MPWPLINLAVAFLAFGALARLTPCNPNQRAFVGRDLADNALYWVFGVLFLGGTAQLYVRVGAQLLFGAHAPAVTAAIFAGYGPASRLPLVVQSAILLVGMDFIQYWLHRWLHGETLWPFHAVHHSAEDLDWTAAYRIHPVNFGLYTAASLALVQTLGFSPAAFLFLGPFNLVIGPLVHANLDWTFGPFRYVLASPVFHRWHHVKDPAVRNRNFAPTFPVFDLLFGTYYMPRGVLPEGYGVEGMPPGFVGQMIYPFRAVAGRLLRPRAGQAPA